MLSSLVTLSCPFAGKERTTVGTTRLQFSDIYSEFHEKVSRYLERMVGKNDAEDLTQEVFLKINKGLKDFKGKSSLSTWVYRIATNAALDKMKSRSYREQGEMGGGGRSDRECRPGGNKSVRRAGGDQE
jgi:DNA-directed RNA polymerase specialized sigma24 family protein